MGISYLKKNNQTGKNYMNSNSNKNTKKRAVPVKVEWREMPWVVKRAFYTCPTCHVCHEDGVLAENVLRFRCSYCGQEIIIKY